MRLRLITICIFLIAAVTCLPALSHAENCTNLENNPKWQKGMKKLSEYMKNNDTKNALKMTDDLNKICSTSPVLNYLIAQIYKEKGDNVKRVYYLQRATDNTEGFSVDKNLLGRMWYERYEAENPEASSQSLAEKEQKQKVLEQSLQETQHQVNLALAKENKIYQITMWSSVAATIAGIGMFVTGCVLFFKGSDPIEYKVFENNVKKEDKDEVYYENKVRVKGTYGATWALMGAGAAAIVVGSIMTGLSGYNYARTIPDDSIKQELEENVSFHISPTGFSLNMTF